MIFFLKHNVRSAATLAVGLLQPRWSKGLPPLIYALRGAKKPFGDSLISWVATSSRWRHRSCHPSPLSTNRFALAALIAETPALLTPLSVPIN